MDVSFLIGRRFEAAVGRDRAWGFRFSGGLRLEVMCLWRLLVAGELTTTSEDHGHRFGLPTPADCLAELGQRLAGYPVAAAVVRAGTVDMSLGFGDRGTLELISTPAGYEAWVLGGGESLMAGQPGRE